MRMFLWRKRGLGQEYLYGCRNVPLRTPQEISVLAPEVDFIVEEANKNFIHVTVTERANSFYWEATFVYGCPSRAGRVKVWEDIKNLARLIHLPWLCVGDFNQVLNVGDNIGGHVHSQVSISAFHKLISDSGLVELKYKGPKFTWRNNRSGDNFIMEKIDIVFANSKWCELYDQAMVFVEAAISSDHNPLLQNTVVPLTKVGKPFRFESFWVTEEDCKVVIDRAWSKKQNGTLMHLVCKKLRVCKDNLKEWSKRTFGDLRLKIAVAKEQLIDIQHLLEQGFDQDLTVAEIRLKLSIEDMWQNDAMYWHQRSRIKWLQMGDKNSRFFHLSRFSDEPVKSS
ncbi:hypothetical protein Vadar_019378 [Vaccinium darrowii]|uniref:Uncharacterized protein n=1 Tax=Vaccinium darrowii TaxID=229202 RepID=A0ACB7ZCS5_9ERIC|nr:hypothetical protein Vadar_019378 [Vaccinium darrowii]